jgi:hypothetical protein
MGAYEVSAQTFEIFLDDFESGDVIFWSSAVP